MMLSVSMLKCQARALLIGSHIRAGSEPNELITSHHVNIIIIIINNNITIITINNIINIITGFSYFDILKFENTTRYQCLLFGESDLASFLCFLVCRQKLPLFWRISNELPLFWRISTTKIFPVGLASGRVRF